MSERKGIRVLIVDDDFLTCELLQTLLEKSGYRVVGRAEDGQAAVQKVLSLRPDVVLMDIGLPDMDGISVTERIYQICPTPVVVVTAYDSPELLTRASAAGVGAYLIKPPKAVELERVIPLTIARFSDMMELRRLNSQLQGEIAERRRAEAALQQRNNELALLYRAGQKFSSTLNLKQVLEYVLDEMRQLLGGTAASVWLSDSNTQELVCYASRGPKSEEVWGWRLPCGAGLVGWIAKEGKGVNVPDVRVDPRYYPGVDQKTGLGLRSILGSPLRVNEVVIGVIQVLSTQVNRFQAVNLELVESLAASAAIAIDNAGLYQEVDRLFAVTQAALTQTETLYAISRLSGKLENNPAALRAILEAVAQVLGADRSLLMTLDMEARTISRLIMAGPGAESSEPVSFEGFWDALGGQVILEESPVLVRKADVAGWEPSGVRSWWERLDVGAAVAAPLRFQPQGRGVLALLNRADGADFDPEVLDSLMAMGNQLSTALENSALIQSLRESEGRFRSVVQTAGNVIICLSLDFIILEWNREAERVYGWLRDEVLGENYLSRFVEPASWEVVNRWAEDALRGHGMSSFESPVLSRDGTQRYLLWNMNRLQDGQGQPSGLIISGQDITERKLAEERVVQSRDFYLTLFDEFPTPIWRSDVKGNLDYFNRTWLAFTGRTLEQEAGTGWLEGLPVEEQERYWPFYRAAFEARRPFEFECRLRHVSGEYRWMAIIGRPFADLDGHFAGYIGSCYDLTARKQAEMALASSEARYRAVVEDLPMLVCRFRPDGTLTFVNETYARYFEQPRDQLLGQDFLTLLPPVERSRVRLHFLSLSPEKPVSTIEHQIILSNGEVRWQRWIDRAVFDGGELVELQSIGEDITDYRRASEALRESEERYRQLFETSRDGIAITDLEGRLVDCNRAFLDLLAYESFDALQAQPFENVTPEEYREVEHLVIREETLVQGYSEEYEKEYLRRSGERVPVVVRTWLRRDSQDQPVGLWVMVHDITERKRAEVALQELNRDLRRQARELAALNRAGQAITSTLELNAVLDLVIREARTLLDAQGVSVLLCDLQTEVLTFAASVGPGAEQLLGMQIPPTAGIAGWVMQNREPALVNDVWQDPRFYSGIDQVTGLMTHSVLAVPLIFKETGIGVIEAVNKAGQPFDTHDLTILQGMSASAVIAIENARLYSQVQQELAERKRTEVELRHLNEDLVALNALATEIGQRLDLEHVLHTTMEQVMTAVSIDGAWIQLMNESQDPGSLALVVQRGLSLEMAEALQSPELVETVCRQVADLTDPHALLLPVELEVETQPYAVVVPLRSKEKVQGFLGVMCSDGQELDLQDLQLLGTIGHQVGVAVENVRLAEKTAEIEVLRQLDRLRSELIANVSHELRTPLGLIKIFATTLMREDVALDGATYREFLQNINEETDRLEKLVDNLLDLSRMQDGRMQLDRQPYDIREVIQAVVSAMGPQFTSHRLELDLGDDPLVASFDIKRIDQVLRNLFHNAIKYSPEGGSIEIHTRYDGEHVLIWVSDQGIGIPQEHLEKVFERFYRVQNTFTQSVSGVGLGLAVCRGIVEAHHGRIWAESRLGEGSTFYFTLPAEMELE